MKIAVIGSGISGLTAAYLLRKHHEVILFEAAERFGGHTHTVLVPEGHETVPVDTGFIVYNERTYPLFVKLLAEWQVPTQPSDMSFSVTSSDEDFEFNGTDLNGLFAQRRNLLRPSFYRMLGDIVKFNRSALALSKSGDGVLSLEEFLKPLQLGENCLQRYVYPMGAAIWSTPVEEMPNFSALFFARFFANHGLLNYKDRPQWRVITGGSRVYLDRALELIGAVAQNRAAVLEVERRLDSVTVTTASGTEKYDAVILACHSDEALALLGDASAEERRILGAIPYAANDVVLHTDTTVMPRRRRAWASWNYRATKTSTGVVKVTYWMNLLQNLTSQENYFVTLNDTNAIDPRKIIGRYTYSHPRFCGGAEKAQAAWTNISGKKHTHFCGAYWRNGFHEDGVWSATRVAKALGSPW